LFVHVDKVSVGFCELCVSSTISLYQNFETVCNKNAPEPLNDWRLSGSISNQSFFAMFWPGLCLTILLCSARFSVHHAGLWMHPFYCKVFLQS